MLGPTGSELLLVRSISGSGFRVSSLGFRGWGVGAVIVLEIGLGLTKHAGLGALVSDPP